MSSKLWSSGKLIEFAPPGAQGQAEHMNAAGDVVGYTYDTKYHGFLYHNRVFRALGDLPGATANDSIGTLAHGINNHGVIVGQSSDARGDHAVVFGNNGMPRILPGGANSAVAINDAGQILAEVFLATNIAPDVLLINPNGKVQDLGPLVGKPEDLNGVALNSRGDIIINSSDPSIGTAGFLISHGKPMRVANLTGPDASYFSAGGGGSSQALGINDAGQVVGFSSYNGLTPGGGIWRPILFQNGATRDLSLSVDPTTAQGLLTASAINNRGVILANLGTNFGGASVLLKPVAGGSISGAVYHDDNADGVRQPKERGLAGRTVYIDANNNGVLDYGEESTITTVGGRYSFANLGPGHYIVREELPLGRQTTPPRVIDLKVGQQVSAQDFGVTGSTVGWRVVDLGALAAPGTPPQDDAGPASFANAINDAGQVVGESDTSRLFAEGGGFIQHAFLYSGGKMIDLTPTSANDTAANGINNKGQIVGELGPALLIDRLRQAVRTYEHDQAPRDDQTMVAARAL